MAAAIAVKDWLAASRREGSIRFYGTPAEEGGAGKVYMVRAGRSIGMKGMLLAAKTMALTGVELFTDPAHIQKARAEFDRRRGDVVYKAVIGDRKPPLDYRKEE
jgi:aminobenzoyl-glutamate utilization protein B